ncbi:M16 family metallopeptidase [Amycolatopsis plumensis]|uniref:M16 family metallopeptidase n=1 Tax=Amycolatopsis plumensis TaxID=236508 RepID=A0ABV5UAA1_9PSEU
MTVELSGTDIPALQPRGRLSLPESAETTLPNGLTVLAVRRPSAPLVELRLRIPLVEVDPASAALLAESLCATTASTSAVELTSRLQRMGGTLTAGVDADRLLVVGSALAAHLADLLGILGEILTGACYPEAEVAQRAARLAGMLRIVTTQPAHRALEALNRRLYGKHVYGRPSPSPEEVLSVTSEDLLALHADRVRATSACLVLAGDIDPEQALRAAGNALSGLDGGEVPKRHQPLSDDRATETIEVLDAPGAVQSSVRLALPCAGFDAPDLAAVDLANIIFGGIFSSRLPTNIREHKGYTYSAKSTLVFPQAGAAIAVTADVATAVTAPAVLEIRYELGRMACTSVTTAEVDQAREYLFGVQRLGMATQSGLANLVSELAAHSLRLDWLNVHSERLAEAGVAEVNEAAARYLAPAQAVTVVVGDAARVTSRLTTLMPVI